MPSRLSLVFFIRIIVSDDGEDDDDADGKKSTRTVSVVNFRF